MTMASPYSRPSRTSAASQSCAPMAPPHHRRPSLHSARRAIDRTQSYCALLRSAASKALPDERISVRRPLSPHAEAIARCLPQTAPAFRPGQRRCWRAPRPRYDGPVSGQGVPGGVVHELPADVREALLANATALDAWNDITPLARNEFICWVEDAKQETTRARRIRRTQEELEEGQRRPCCWPGCKHRDRTGK